MDKPLIQYAVEEALEARAERLVFVTGSSKRAIEDHFDTDAELERQLAEAGKHDLLEPFFVHLADDLIYNEVGCLQQMRLHFEQHGASVLGVETVPHDQTGCYGIVAVQAEKDGAQRVTRIVEKPKPADAPSNLAVVGRYILTPGIFGKLESTQRGAGGEIQLTDGIPALLADEAVYVLPFAGIRYD